MTLILKVIDKLNEARTLPFSLDKGRQIEKFGKIESFLYQKRLRRLASRDLFAFKRKIQESHPNTSQYSG